MVKSRHKLETKKKRTLDHHIIIVFYAKSGNTKILTQILHLETLKPYKDVKSSSFYLFELFLWNTGEML